MKDKLTERLERCYSAAVHDVMRERGFRNFTFPPEIRPILPDRRLAGPVFTIDGVADPSFDPHETMYAWTGLLSQARPGHVWVTQPNDLEVAHMGELTAETLTKKGVLGSVVDGLIRDVDFLLRMGFQAWSRGFTPRDLVGHWKPRAVDVEIRIGSVLIAPGDYVLGDRDGMVRIPRADAEAIVADAEATMGTENTIRSAVLAGLDPQEAFVRYGKF